MINTDTNHDYITIRQLRQQYGDWKKIKDAEKAKRRIVTVTTCKPCEHYTNSTGDRIADTKLNLSLH